jgi:hypothetical protein
MRSCTPQDGLHRLPVGGSPEPSFRKGAEKFSDCLSGVCRHAPLRGRPFSSGFQRRALPGLSPLAAGEPTPTLLKRDPGPTAIAGSAPGVLRGREEAWLRDDVSS